MTLPAIHITRPATLLTFSHSRSTFRITRSFREGTDRWISGPRTPAGWQGRRVRTQRRLQR